jgi:hypothetical protein
MSRKQLELAAKLYGLSMIAHTELSDDDSEADCNKVRRLAAKRATTKLRNLGTDPSEICDEMDAQIVAGNILSNSGYPTAG